MRTRQEILTATENVKAAIQRMSTPPIPSSPFSLIALSSLTMAQTALEWSTDQPGGAHFGGLLTDLDKNRREAALKAALEAEHKSIPDYWSH